MESNKKKSKVISHHFHNYALWILGKICHHSNYISNSYEPTVALGDAIILPTPERWVSLAAYTSDFTQNHYLTSLWHPTPVLLPGKSHGWRSLVGCSPWGREESDASEQLHFHFFTFMHWRRKWQPTPVFLPGESQGRRSLVGCCLWGRTESGTTERLHFHFLDNLSLIPFTQCFKPPGLWFLK